MLKSFFSFAVVLMSIHFGFATGNFNTPTTNSHSETTVTKKMSLNATIAQLETHLIAGNWTENKNDHTHTDYHFHDYGMVDMITTKANGTTTMNSALWTIESHEEQVYLVLTQPPANDITFHEISMSGDDMILSGKSNLDTKVLMPTAIKNNAGVIKKVKKSVTGTWKIEAPSNENYMKYYFHENGTFSFSMGNKSVNISEEGVWEISSDGKYIMFYITNNDKEQVTSRTSVARIISASDDTLRLEKTITIPDFENMFSKENQKFTLKRTR